MVIRPLQPTDCFSEITALLHASYARLKEMDLHFMATHQSVSVTEERALEGQTFILEVDGQLAGVITVRLHEWPEYGEYQVKEKLAIFGQFAVRPDLQGRGYGEALIARAEEYARSNGCAEMGLDTAQGAHHLIRYYERLGYEIKARADWRPEVNYESWIMVKSLRQ